MRMYALYASVHKSYTTQITTDTQNAIDVAVVAMIEIRLGPAIFCVFRSVLLLLKQETVNPGKVFLVVFYLATINVVSTPL